jgi:hypothetical protein
LVEVFGATANTFISRVYKTTVELWWSFTWQLLTSLGAFVPSVCGGDKERIKSTTIRWTVVWQHPYCWFFGLQDRWDLNPGNRPV